MSKPQYSSRTATLSYLTKHQALLLLACDEKTGTAGWIGDDEVPEWLIEQCHDLGLIMPASRPGAWKLSQDGWDARLALLAD